MNARRLGAVFVVGAALSLLLGAGTAGAGPDAAPGAADTARILGVFERALTPEQDCEVEFLRHLGWRFVTDPAVKRVTIDAGHPGRHENVAAVHAAGGLHVRVPAGFDVASARASADALTALADSVASRLAYRHKLVGPVNRATKRLAEMTVAGRHVFPEIFELFHSPHYRLDMPRTEWVLRDRMYFAETSSSRAMEAFYRLGSTSECYVGQLLALYGVQYELLGRDWFHHVIPANELVVGRPKDVIKTPLLKLLEYELPHDWRALVLDRSHQQGDPVLLLAPHGPIAFTGLAGVVLNKDESCFAQDNMLIVSASRRAVDQLVSGGGIKHFDSEAARVWEHAADNKGLNVGGIFTIGGLSEEAEAAIDAILEQPMFSEIQVYVHPDGVVPLGFTVKKFVTRTETPVTLRINMNGLDAELYRRYRKAFVDGCMAQREARARTSVTCPTR